VSSLQAGYRVLVHVVGGQSGASVGITLGPPASAAAFQVTQLPSAAAAPHAPAHPGRLRGEGFLLLAGHEFSVIPFGPGGVGTSMATITVI